jgi:hypothetical protein
MEPEKETGAGLRPTPKTTDLKKGYACCCHEATRVERRPPVHALEILAEIMRLRVIQEPIGRIFWALEQRIARLTDEIERRES